MGERPETIDARNKAYYWQQVYEILEERCCRFDHPLLSPSFIEMNSDRICFVEEGCAQSGIVALCKDSGKSYPFFVVEEKTGKMLGIALNRQLIIAGVINRRVLSRAASDIMQLNGTHYLSSQDVEWLPFFQKEVSLMLSEVGLEPLAEWYWYYEGRGLPKAWNCETQWKSDAESRASVIGKF